MTIGFVGVGRMGANMARRLKDRGYHVTTVFDVNRSAATSLATELGCAACQTLGDVTAGADMIFTIVTDDNAMREIYTGGDNLLANALSMGFSTRYGQRTGLGRFGVGLKLAALSQARRVDIYTRPMGQDLYFHAYIDLDLINRHEQEYIEAVKIDGYPAEYADLMTDLQGKQFESGTLVVWSRVDRLSECRHGQARQHGTADQGHDALAHGSTTIE